MQLQELQEDDGWFICKTITSIKAFSAYSGAIYFIFFNGSEPDYYML